MIRFDFKAVVKATEYNNLVNASFKYWEIELANDQTLTINGIVAGQKDLLAFCQDFKNSLKSVDIYLESENQEKFQKLGYSTFSVEGGDFGIKLLSAEDLVVFLDHVK